MKIENAFKVGQKVKVSHRGQEPVAGKVVQVIPGSRGSFIEVDHGNEVVKRYRPVAVTPA